MKNATWWKFWTPESGVFGAVVAGSLWSVHFVLLMKFLSWLIDL